MILRNKISIVGIRARQEGAFGAREFGAIVFPPLFVQSRLRMRQAWGYRGVVQVMRWRGKRREGHREALCPPHTTSKRGSVAIGGFVESTVFSV